MEIKRVFWFLFAALCMGSCKPVTFLTAEITYPAQQKIDNQVQSLLLVNRAANLRFTDDPADTIQLRFYRQSFRLDTTINAIHATDTLLQTLAALLFESGRFDVVIPEDRFLLRDTLQTGADSMDWEQVSQLTQNFNTDALLSLEYFSNNISTMFYSGWDYSLSSDLPVMFAEMGIAYTALFRLYDPRNRSSVESFFFSDTLLWEDDDLDTKQLFLRFTNVKDGMDQSAIEAALQLAETITPTWQSVNRFYFHRGHRLLQEAHTYIVKDEWEQASALWHELSQKKVRKKLLSKAEFNMALAWELRGDLEEAIRWGLKSYHNCYRKITWNYLDTLKERKILLSEDNENN